MESRRAESFSDGVFAVAITVLVFNLLPIADQRIAKASDITRYWPQYGAYAVSFLTIGIMWLNHHTLLSYVARVDRIMLVLNTLLLMGVVAVPFPTALIANSHGPHPHVNASIAAITYGLLLIAISFAFSGMWFYLAAHQQKLAAWPIRAPVQSTLRFGVGTIGYLTGTALSYVWPDVSVILYALVAVYYLFEHLPDPVAAAAAAGSGSGSGGASGRGDPAGSGGAGLGLAGPPE